MDAFYETLKSIDERLSDIEVRLSANINCRSLDKRSYSSAEVAELTAGGVTSYRPFTIRQACNDGRIPEAEKLENGLWSLPRKAVERILREGLPPERRTRQS